jgi:multiple sugar transport system ATP-binding protein
LSSNYLGSNLAALAEVTFEHVGKVYPDGTRAVADLNLEVQDGEFVVLVGPSGCGKTTALRMVAGLEEINEGTIRIGDAVVNRLPPPKRDVAMVFQNYALYPQMSVYDNIAFGLKMRKVAKPEIRRRVEGIARVLGLRELLDRKPGVLSGGQRQRVAMGRAIVRDPQVFLMDEPLSNLDAKLRVQMRAEIARIQRELGATTIYVTHDQIEAMTMGERVAVLRRGVLQQVDRPQRIYESPANLFVASFIGSPSMNIVEAHLARERSQLVCRVGEHVLEVPDEVVAGRPELTAYVGRTIGLGMRPENLGDGASARNLNERRRLAGRAVTTELLGSELLAHVEISAVPVLTEEVIEVASDVDHTLLENLKSEARKHRSVIVARFDAASHIHVDQPIDLVVDTRKLYFFDLETEHAIPLDRPAERWSAGEARSIG